MSDFETPPKLISARSATIYYLASLWMRPSLTYSLIVCILAVTGTTCALMWTGDTTLTESNALLITIVSACIPVLTALVVGKSWERTKGIRDDSVVEQARPSRYDREHRDERPIMVGRGGGNWRDDDDDNADTDSSSALDALNNISGLDDYMPRKADDNPSVN